MGSFNLIWAVFHEWIGIAQDIRRAPWRHKLSYLLREPGWSHDGSRQTSDQIRADWIARSPAANKVTANKVAVENAIAETGKPT